MKPDTQPVFRALDMSFALCATASIQDFGHSVSETLPGVLWGRHGYEWGELDGRIGRVASIVVISFPDRFPKAVNIVATVAQKGPVYATSIIAKLQESSCFAMCIPCIFLLIWWLY